jgi:hypothetical protein
MNFRVAFLIFVKIVIGIWVGIAYSRDSRFFFSIIGVGKSRHYKCRMKPMHKNKLKLD